MLTLWISRQIVNLLCATKFGFNKCQSDKTYSVGIANRTVMKRLMPNQSAPHFPAWEAETGKHVTL